MLLNPSTNRIKIRKFDYLLILGFMLAPMTEFRIWKMGPAELLCVLWSMRYLPSILNIRSKSILHRFWNPFLFIVLVGTVFCMIQYPQQSSGFTGYLTWVFMAIVSLGIYYGLSRCDKAYILKLLELMVFCATFWYLFLYLYSVLVSKSFFGARLYYANRRFTGGGANPHQIAGLAVNCIFILLYLFHKTHISRKRFYYLIFIGFNLFFISLTFSSTSIMAVAVGLFVAILENYIRKGKDRDKKSARFLIIVVLMLLVLLFFFSYLFEAFYQWVASDPNGLGRFELFSTIGDAVKKSPVFGLGPGSHSMWGRMEFHNSYLELLAMSGIAGVGVFIIFSFRLFSVCLKEPQAILAPVAMYVFGFAGFGMRRLPYWIVVTIMLVSAIKSVEISQIKRLKDYGETK